MTTGMCAHSSIAARIRWRRNGAPAYLRAPAEACTITGLSVSAAASMIARICSRLLTLNAGTPYLYSAAWSSSCRSVTSAMVPPERYKVGNRNRSIFLAGLGSAHHHNLHCIGPAQYTGQIALGDNDDIAFTYRAAPAQLIDGFAVQLGVVIGADIEGHRVNAAIEGDFSTRLDMTRQGINGNAGADARHPQRSSPRFCKGGDGLHVQVIGGVHRGHGNGFVDACEHLVVAVSRARDLAFLFGDP